MAAEIIQINTQDFTSQTYEGQDSNLISTFDVNTFFESSSYIEYFTYDNNRNVLASDYNFTQYIIQNDGQSAGNGGNISQITIDPEQVLINDGFDQGEYITYFNFFNKKIGSDLQQLYIAEISSDRTEIRLDSTTLSNLDIVEQTTTFIQERETSTYFLDFYLNFGENQLVIANNVVLDNQDPTNPTILVKLYEPLPEEFNINSTLWVVTTLEESVAYQVIFEDEPIVFNDFENISGPNFNIDLKDRVNNSTQNLSYIDLITTSLTSSQNQLNSLLEEKEIDINVDYTNFSNYIHFSSAQTRLENFYYKIQLIEQYSSSIAILNNTINSSSSISSSAVIYENKISDIITNFDGYEYFLYYENNQYAWPKTNTQKPYELAKSDNIAVLSWIGSTNEYSPYYGGLILSASLYDNDNKDNLLFTIPEYLRDDSENEQYELFVQMVAQHYDNIWIYYNEVTQKYNADNRLEYGISKDIVADAIRDFGVKLYQNNFSNEDLYTAFLGITPEGGLFPFPNITGSLPTPSGFEYVDTLISASNDYIPLDDVNKSLYKRIYHNLPYLLKSKGTLPGLRALITSYGIPDTILRINEFGGKDKINVNDWDSWQDEFNYAFYTEGTNFVSSSFGLNSNWGGTCDPNDCDTIQVTYALIGEEPVTIEVSASGIENGKNYYNFTIGLNNCQLEYLDGQWRLIIFEVGLQAVLSEDIDCPFGTYNTNAEDSIFESFAVDCVSPPSTIEFRFKAEEFPPTYRSQSLMYLNGGGEITLQYTGSGLTSGSYSGSIIDPEYQFAHLTFYPSSSNLTISASVYLPFFNEGWWSVMLTSGSNGFGLYAGNNIYEGGDNNTVLGFYASSSVTSSYNCWNLTNTIYFATGSLFNKFSGSLQEIRYYNVALSESVFKDYIVNPYSTEGNSLNSSPDELTFRAPLGGELYTGSVSVHPKVTGSWVITHSFASGNSNFYFNQTPVFIPNTEYFFADQPVAGIKNIVNDKIRIEDNVLPEGDTLSPFKALSQQANISQSYTPNINYLEVAFSPQNELNEDIISQIGYFNIGEFIGDPRLRSSSAESYPALDQLRNEYFNKYIKNYNLTDFIRLIKFFDNSLFKMIRDFVPARTSLASGIVIKQHLLERNKYPQPQMSWEDLDISGTLKPTWNGYEPGTVENFSGGTGGSFEQFNLVTNTSQSWMETIQTVSGSVFVLHNSQDEFYDGEFSGSTLLISDGTLNEAYPVSTQTLNYKPVHYYGNASILPSPSDENSIFQSNFLNNATSPKNGEILFFDFSIRVFQFPSFVNIRNAKYIKIAKIDCDGDNNSNSLGYVNKLVIETPIFSLSQNVWLTYNVIKINETPEYYTYSVTSVTNTVLPSLNRYNPSNTENQVLDYTVSSSNPSNQQIYAGSIPTTIGFWTTTSGNVINYFNTSSGIYTLENTPNTPLSITGSTVISGSNGRFSIFLERQNSATAIVSGNYTSEVPIALSASYYGLQGDLIYLAATKTGGGITVTKSGSLLITQSRAVSSSNCNPIIPEPYITTANFYNSDENALLNSVDGLRDSSYYMDVDYTRGITNPVNFGFLISGSATRAKVQDSNYTTKRHIIPRYLGSKSTSQRLNAWTPPDPTGISDSGTYGKLPTIESLTAYVAYSTAIAGWPPERMNASAIIVKYLIDQNGDVIIPNVSENSLPTIQEAFQTGKRLRISPQGQVEGDIDPYRTIIRGGSRIEPILYTQIGSAPTASWVSDIRLEDIVPGNSGGVVRNFRFSFTLLTQTFNVYPYVSPQQNNISLYGTPTYVGDEADIYNVNIPPLTALGYKVTPEAVEDGVGLIFEGGYITKFKFRALLTAFTPFGNYRPSVNITFSVRLIRKNSSGTTVQTWVVKEGSISRGDFFGDDITSTEQLNLSSVTIPPQDVKTDETYHLIFTYTPDQTLDVFEISGGGWKMSQYPNATDAIPVGSGGTSLIWGYYNSGSYPYVITSSNPSLVSLYGNPEVKQQDVTGSGFNPVKLPWSIKYADEFRFEGREDLTYQVYRIFGPTENPSERLSNTGSIEVHFNANLPTGSDPSVFNIDHFLIRRYVDDASQIIMEGFKPMNTDGPYIITPEYVTDTLNKSADAFITDLTERGLL